MSGIKKRIHGRAADATLILRPARIDVLVPQQDPAGHALDVLEALLAEDLGELQAIGRRCGSGR